MEETKAAAADVVSQMLSFECPFKFSATENVEEQVDFWSSALLQVKGSICTCGKKIELAPVKELLATVRKSSAAPLYLHQLLAFSWQVNADEALRLAICKWIKKKCVLFFDSTADKISQDDADAFVRKWSAQGLDVAAFIVLPFSSGAAGVLNTKSVDTAVEFVENLLKIYKAI
jgi:hypothetical protein